ncbi:MAG TPA: hypothetical protein VHB79_26460 [Polyangiaceae bacterium]|nr:hypothetical protein [Polyangiaceae bacterium]
MRALTVLSALSLLAGCGGDSASGDAEDADPVRQGSVEFYQPARGVPQVALIVVDDSPDQEGRDLRASVAGAFVESYDSSRVNAVESCTPPADPARPSLVRRFAIVVGASGVGEAGVHSFADDDELSWIADERSDADASRWSNAVAAAIEGTETTQPDVYQPLALAEHWVRLLARETEPRTERERAVLEALPARVDVEPFLASTREDQSPLPAADYRLDSSESCSGGGACVAEPQSYAQDPRHFFDAGFFQDCSARCGGGQPLKDDTGAVECRVLLAALHVQECDESLGWQETSLRSDALEQWAEGAATDFRICEVAQLEGAALRSCQNELSCADCTPGFCSTSVPELVSDCAHIAPFPWSLRFPQLPPTPLMFEVRCNFEP